MTSQPPPQPPPPSLARRAARAVGRFLFKVVRVFFILLMVIIPVPIVSFLDKTKQRQQKNPATEVLREDQEP